MSEHNDSSIEHQNLTETKGKPRDEKDSVPKITEEQHQKANRIEIIQRSAERNKRLTEVGKELRQLIKDVGGDSSQNMSIDTMSAARSKSISSGKKRSGISKFISKGYEWVKKINK